MSIAVAHSTPNPIHKPDNNKYLPYCKCMNQITCGVCHKPMDRINPLYKANMSIIHNQPDNKSMKKSKSQQLFNQSSDNMILIENIKLNFAEWFTWCLTCKHVSHLEHAEEWFQSHTECPIPDCGYNIKAKEESYEAAIEVCKKLYRKKAIALQSYLDTVRGLAEEEFFQIALRNKINMLIKTCK